MRDLGISPNNLNANNVGIGRGRGEEDSVDVDPSTMNAHKTALEQYAFLISWTVIVGEKIPEGREETTTAKGKRGGKGACLFLSYHLIATMCRRLPVL